MKEIKVKNYVSKKDIKFSDYLELKKLVPNPKAIEEIDPDFLIQRMLKIFYNINPSDYRLLKQEQVDILMDKINNVLNSPISPFNNIITLNGVQYGFIPNFEDITVGELIDMDERYKAEDYISLTSILYRPVKGLINPMGEYEIEDYTGFDNKFANITLDLVEGYLHFFQKSFQDLKHSTLISIQRQKNRMKKMKK